MVLLDMSLEIVFSIERIFAEGTPEDLVTMDGAYVTAKIRLLSCGFPDEFHIASRTP